MRNWFLLPFLAITFILFSSNAYATTYLSDCNVSISTSGETYILTTDLIDKSGIISGSSYMCFHITGNNITFDCQNHLFDGTLSYGHNGVYITGSDVTFKNCVIRNWALALENEGTNNNITNITIVDNDWPIYGFGNYATYDNISVSGYYYVNAMYGRVEISGTGVTFKNSFIKDRVYHWYYDVGITADNIYGNVFQNISVLRLNGKIYNNLFNMTGSITLYGTSYLNTTRQNGTRVYSPGYEIGGNWWTNSTGNGFSNICTDTNYDGFCDNSNPVAGTYDYLPYSPWYVAGYTPPSPPNETYNGTIINVTTCGVITSPGYYQLQNDIYFYSWNGSYYLYCGAILNTHDVTLDFNGHYLRNSILYWTPNGYYGLVIFNSTNITLKNGGGIFFFNNTGQYLYGIASSNSSNLVMDNISIAVTDTTSAAILSVYYAIENTTNITGNNLRTSGNNPSNYGLFLYRNNGNWFIKDSSFASSVFADIYIPSLNNKNGLICNTSYGVLSNSGTNSTVTSGPCPVPCVACLDWVNGTCYNSTHIIQTRTCSPSGCTGNATTQYVNNGTCCSCGSWSSGSCFNVTHRAYTRTCNPSGCSMETEYRKDFSCINFITCLYSCMTSSGSCYTDISRHKFEWVEQNNNTQYCFIHAAYQTNCPTPPCGYASITDWGYNLTANYTCNWNTGIRCINGNYWSGGFPCFPMTNITTDYWRMYGGATPGTGGYDQHRYLMFCYDYNTTNLLASHGTECTESTGGDSTMLLPYYDSCYNSTAIASSSYRWAYSNGVNCGYNDISSSCCFRHFQDFSSACPFGYLCNTTGSVHCEHHCTCSNWTCDVLSQTKTRTCDPSGCDVESMADTTSCGINPFFNTWMIAGVVIIAIAIGFALYIGGDQLAIFLIVSSTLFFMGALIGLFPKWIIILSILGIGYIVTKYILKMLGVGDSD